MKSRDPGGSSGRARRAGVVLLLLVLAAQPAWGARVRSVGLADMASRAERIFVGRCVDVDVSVHASLGIPVTAYAFAVTDPIKGVTRGRVTFRVPGTPADPWIDGLPVFERGEEALVFLYPESEAGFSSAVGLEQGRFRLLTEGTGRRVAVNGRGNDRLLDDVPDHVLAAHGLRRAGGALPLEKIVGAARALIAGRRP